ncbi:MAG: hypothetical protein ACC642_00030 [Pseudomonadales bacterium]
MEDALAALLADPQAGDGAEGENQEAAAGRAGDGGADSAIESFSAVAEKLGVDVAKLYEMQVPMPDGAESLTLSELKDRSVEYERSQVEQVEWTDKRTRDIEELAQAREQLATLVAMIPANLRTPQLLQAAQSEQARVRQQQSVALANRIPEWKDEATRLADKALIAKYVEPFGFTPEELGQVYDARLFALLRHVSKRDEQMKALLDTMRGKRKRNPAKRTSNKPAGTESKRRTGSDARSAKIDNVAALITE